MGDLSAHFSRHEFDSHDGARAAPTVALIAALEKLRARKGGAPLRIISGYRSPAHNRAVGGAKKSRHMFNDAADIPKGYCNIDDAIAAGFRGIGFCGNSVVHVDMRPGRRVIFEDC